jgi:hypothetical protein
VTERTINANKLNELLILLEQGIRRTVRRNQVDSTACVGLAKTNDIGRAELGAVREDPNWDAAQSAFYDARHRDSDPAVNAL